MQFLGVKLYFVSTVRPGEIHNHTPMLGGGFGPTEHGASVEIDNRNTLIQPMNSQMAKFSGNVVINISSKVVGRGVIVVLRGEDGHPNL